MLQRILLAMLALVFILVPITWVGFKIDDYLYEKKMKQRKERKDL